MPGSEAVTQKPANSRNSVYTAAARRLNLGRSVVQSGTSYTTNLAWLVTRNVEGRRLKVLGGQEMFVPLTHPPGDAQADFGEALVVIDGVECKAHDLVVDLPHSDDAFVKAFPAETTEAFCDGHNAAFRYFGGVPRGIVYDNTTLAVAKILGDRTRQRTQVFSELQSHDLFDDRFGRPGKGNDKGKVEGLVGSRRTAAHLSRGTTCFQTPTRAIVNGAASRRSVRLSFPVARRTRSKSSG